MPEGCAKITPLGLLKRYVGDRETPILMGEGRAVAEVLEALDTPSALATVVLINGRQESKSYVL